MILVIFEIDPIPHRIRDPIHRPQPYRRFPLGLDAGIRRLAVFHRLTRFRPHLPPCRTAALLPIRDDPGIPIDLGAVFGAVPAVRARDGDQPLAVETETIPAVVIDATPRPVLGDGLTAG